MLIYLHALIFNDSLASQLNAHQIREHETWCDDTVRTFTGYLDIFGPANTHSFTSSLVV